jgi:GT2 family glycosyltransferase
MDSMKLSIIIVSYNVSAFLENCLSSVFKALKNIHSEVIVVDNHSVDDTVFMIKEKFPDVHLIENQSNTGFAVANNQAIKLANGKYILLLNPDTIVSENCFEMSISFMDEHPGCGALGVKMFDGSGAFLPESKRGFPTPFASFSKMTGLYQLFPRSKVWNRYYLGHLDEDEINEIDVLTGAYFFIRRSIFDKIEPLDESFFMYGEDIDLSYRIIKAGYSIYYFPTTNIIHFKGESTKKGSLDYVKTFYQAMIIFAQKHFQGTQSWLLVQILKIGIYFAAFSSFFTKKFKSFLPILLDFGLIVSSIFLVTAFWSRYYYHNPAHFDHHFYQINVPVYVIIMLLSLYVRGAYHKYVQWRQFLSGIVWGIASILIVYALLPLEYRSSRIIIPLFAFVFLIIGSLARYFIQCFSNKSLRSHLKRVLFIGGPEEYSRIRELINRSAQNIQMVGALSLKAQFDPGMFLNQISELEEVARIEEVDEIIFSSDQLDFSEITRWMTRLGSKYDYKIASEQSWQIIGSASKNMAGEFYGMDIEFKIDHSFVKRNKRLLDLLSCLFLFIISPVLIFKIKKPGRLYSNIYSVFVGDKSWVGYQRSDPQLKELPFLKDGVVQIQSKMIDQGSTSSFIHNFNYLYAKDYRVWFDIEQIFINLNSLDQE